VVEKKPSGPRRGKDVGHPLKVSLEDLYKGKTSKLALQKQVLCGKCDGKGGKEGAVKTCRTCNGQGVKVTTRQLGPMIQQYQSTCGDCNGEGESINEKDKCNTCRGKKVINERKVLEVFIDKGMKDGQKITFTGEGDQAPGIIPGDVVIVLEEKEHSTFKRKGNDLLYHAKIDLLTALAGGKFAINHLDGRELIVTIIPGEVIKPDDLKMIEKEGMPIHRHHNHGNLYIRFEIEFPKPNFCSEEQLSQLEKILPQRQPQPMVGDDTEEVVLSNCDATHQSRMESVEQDEESEMHNGHGGVQCAQQ